MKRPYITHVILSELNKNYKNIKNINQMINQQNNFIIRKTYQSNQIFQFIFSKFKRINAFAQYLKCEISVENILGFIEFTQFATVLWYLSHRLSLSQCFFFCEFCFVFFFCFFFEIAILRNLISFPNTHKHTHNKKLKIKIEKKN